ncbi:MAG: hypothetical protein V1664_05000 [Candidatus Uhrbacteria bacterium]
MRFVTYVICLFSVLALFVAIPHSLLASADTGTCSPPGTVVSTSGISSTDIAEVGPFMVGVCQECWDFGDCGLNDILTVAANIGNYILSIVGGLVFLVYILGAAWWIGSHGDNNWVKKGHAYIKNASIGLVIVLFAYAGVWTLQSIIRSGSVGGDNAYTICDGSAEKNGQACGLNMECTPAGCTSKCDKTYPGARTCSDITSTDPSVSHSGCLTNDLCPGGENMQCCAFLNPATTPATTPTTTSTR